MGLTRADISRQWVAQICCALARTSSHVSVQSFRLTELISAQGVISRYASSTRESIVGHRVLTIHWTSALERFEHRVLLKCKAPGPTIRRRIEEVYRKLDPQLADVQALVTPSILDDCHTRELQVYELERPHLQSITPQIYRVWRNDATQVFVIAMELLENVRHLNTLADLDVWTDSDVAHVLTGIAGVHGDFLGAPPQWLVPFQRLHNERLLDYEAALLAYNARTFPDLFDATRTRVLESLLASASSRVRAIAARPLTLIHGDFTPRNICLRSDDNLCAYDWELAQAHLPQRDVCELLCYVLDPKRGWRDDVTVRLLEHYRTCLEKAAGRPIEKPQFRRDLALALAEFCSFKLLVQGVTHQLLGNRYYFERLVHNAFAGVEALGKEAFT